MSYSRSSSRSNINAAQRSNSFLVSDRLHNDLEQSMKPGRKKNLMVSIPKNVGTRQLSGPKKKSNGKTSTQRKTSR